MMAERVGASSSILRTISFYLLCGLAVFLLLFYSGDSPIFPAMGAQGSSFVTEAAAWCGSVFCLGLMWRLNRALKPAVSVTRTVLSLFVLFFTIERLASRIFGRFLQDQIHAFEWIQVFSALAVVIGTASIYPHQTEGNEDRSLAEAGQARFLASMESSLDDFYIFDGIADSSGQTVDFRFSYINPNAQRRLNIRREELLGKTLTEVRPYMISSGLIEKYREVVRTGVPLACEVYIDDERIKATWLNIQVVKLGDGIAITSRDVTESRRMAEHVQYLAHFDQLTGLANRTLLQDRLHQAILRARRYRHQVALFVVDFDHFKEINDSLGHSAGDSLLIAAGERLVSVGRATDTVARMGGDEFVIVMPDFRSIEDVKRCGLEIVRRAAEPIAIGEHTVQITASVGVCTFPDHAESEEDLFKNADAAMYAVKESGRNGLQVFHEEGIVMRTVEEELSKDTSDRC